MVKWGKDQNDALRRLWASDPPVADPLRTDAEYIDQFYNGAVFTAVVKKERFRHHYKEKATAWITEQALHGQRRREFHITLVQWCKSF